MQSIFFRACRKFRAIRTLSILICLVGLPAFSIAGGVPDFETKEIDPAVGVGRAVEIADVNGDGKPDILALTDSQVLWYENPDWKKRTIAENLDGTNICLAVRDLDGDGLPEILVGAGWDINNTTSGGSLFVLHRSEDLESPWKSVRILENEPTLHRIHWADPDGDGNPELIVAPLKGRDSTPPYYKDKSLRLLRLTPPEKPFFDPWKVETIDDGRLQIAHGLTSVDWEGNGKEAILVASLSGVNQFVPKAGEGWTWNMQVVGNPEPFPKCGAGEIRIGRHDRDLLLMGTIEPWHGHQAVVYVRKRDFTNPVGRFRLWNRHVVDDTLFGGHAIAWGDFDGDGFDELVAGYRENSKRDGKPGLSLYSITLAWDEESPDPKFSSLKRSIDRQIAVEGVAIGDLDSDGMLDLIAIGRSTENLRMYRNLGGAQ